MRRAGKVDLNQAAIVADLRRCGVQVEVLSAVGRGVPDLLCGWRGINALLEIKTEDGKVRTQQQRDWLDSWPGQVAIVRTFKEAMDAIIHVSQGKQAK